jgi:hypothetical protein
MEHSRTTPTLGLLKKNIKSNERWLEKNRGWVTPLRRQEVLRSIELAKARLAYLTKANGGGDQ